MPQAKMHTAPLRHENKREVLPSQFRDKVIFLCLYLSTEDSYSLKVEENIVILLPAGNIWTFGKENIVKYSLFCEVSCNGIEGAKFRAQNSITV